MIFKKRASLALSVNAIVVIVIAFVVLGLGLTLTRTIFSGAQEKIGPALDIGELETQPSAGTPITIPTLKLRAGKSLKTSAGFYNTDSVKATDAVFEIEKCIDEDGNKFPGKYVIEVGKAPVMHYVPSIVNLPQDVGASKGTGFELLIKEREGDKDLVGKDVKGLPSNKKYICNLIVHQDVTGWKTMADTNKEQYIFEQKQIDLEVVA